MIAQQKGSKLNATKTRLTKSFGENYWVTAGREIENYLPNEMLVTAITQNHQNAHPLATGTDPYEQSLIFRRDPRTKKQKECAEADKVRLAASVAAQAADLSVLNLRTEVRKLASFVRRAAQESDS